MKKNVTCLLATALIISATTALGAVKEESFTVSPVIGGYVFDGGNSLDSTFFFGIRGGYNFTKNFGIEAVYDYATGTDEKNGPLTDITLHRMGGEVLYNFFPDSVFVPYVAAGVSRVKFEGGGAGYGTYGAFDYGVGAKYFLNDDFALRADLRHIIYRANSGTNNDFEFSLGAYVQLGGTQPVMKAVTPAPAPEPAPAPAPAKVVAEPVAEPAKIVAPPPVEAPVVVAPVPVPVPVPVPIPPADSDSDGVIDVRDACPGTPAGVAVGSNGCPVDTDKDGVADYLDKCPGTPAGAAVDAAGCPIDSDKDGVADYLDKCPGTAAGVAVDAKGCTLAAAKKFCDKPAVIAISFDSGKADIKAEFHDELDTLGNFLKEFPNSKGTIEGYTDNAGDKASNIKLSQRRADSVRNYILNKSGIASERIKAAGYGPAKPVADNKTKEGKAKNRRIEANFICE